VAKLMQDSQKSIISSPRRGSNPLEKRLSGKNRQLVLDPTVLVLAVHVISAKNLAKRTKDRTSYPYCVVTLGKERNRTAVIEHTVDPVWDEELAFTTPVTAGAIHIEVWHRATSHELVVMDEFLGQADFPLPQSANMRQEREELLEGRGKDEVICGTIRVAAEIVTFETFRNRQQQRRQQSPQHPPGSPRS